MFHRRRTDDAELRQPCQPFQRGGDQLGFMRLDGVHPDVAQIPCGCSQPDHLRGHGCARLEALRGRRVGGLFHRHGLDHGTAGDERRHRVQQLQPTVEHTDTRGAQHLVTRECREIDIKGVEVDRLVRHRLAGVQDRQGANRPSPPDDFVHRGDGTSDVRMVAERDDFHALVELQRIEVDATVIRDAVPLQRGAGPLGQLLPRNQVRVVLQLRGDDDITGTDGMLEPLVPSTYATRLIDSVAFFVNTNSSGSAPTNAAMSARPCS